jgi:hypothetical protein
MEPETQGAEQPTADSVSEDRIASIFGGGDPEPSEPTEPAEAASAPEGTEPEAAPADETFELEIDGERFMLPKKLEKGFMQERDSTQKAQTLAEQRRAVELAQRNSHLTELKQKFQTETAQELQQLQALEWALSQPVDWNSMTIEDGWKHRNLIESWKDQKSRLEKSLDGKRQEFDQKQQESFAKLVKESLDVVAKRIPGWGPDVARKVTEHALSEGFTDTELRKANTDPRLAVTLWKAQQYDALKSAAKPTAITAKGVKTTPTNPMPAKVRDDLNFRKAANKAQTDTKFAKSGEFRQALDARIASKFGG